MRSTIDVLELTSGATREAERVMRICNACRYCEGVCAAFQAMSERRMFLQTDLDYLANLCHGCTSCYQVCQYAEPHEFNVNVPRALADLRLETYEKYAWPQRLAGLFSKNGLVVSVVTALVVALFLALAFSLQNHAQLFRAYQGEGAFYQVVEHGVIVVMAGSSFLFSLFAIFMGCRRFWQFIRAESQPSIRLKTLLRAIADSAQMTHLSGGHGEGCTLNDERYSNLRRYSHQFTMWGFLLCFAATSVATVYEYIFGWISPFAYTSLPVVLGTLGGIGLLIGPTGLFYCKLKMHPGPVLARQLGMDYGFLALLFLVSLTGLMLLVWRETMWMPLLLIIHLGFVFAFFLLMPYSKFVHGAYRFLALVQFAAEQQASIERQNTANPTT